MPWPTTRSNLWTKHAELLEKSNFQTIKDLASNLVKVADHTLGVPPYLTPGIKSIPPKDGAKMLIDLSLSVIPYGLFLSENVPIVSSIHLVCEIHP